jgi:hypothetical protein
MMVVVLALLMSVGGNLAAQSPVIAPLPPYLPGTFANLTVTDAAGADSHELCYFDSTDPGAVFGCLAPEAGAKIVAALTFTVENLQDGVTYGYYAKAYFSGPADTTFSDTVYATQDASPPPNISNAAAVAAPDGVIEVTWSGVNDAVSSVEQYEVRRRSQHGIFYAIDTTTAVAGNGPGTNYVHYDSLSAGTGLVEGSLFIYEVRAIDAVENRGGGNATGGVTPDSTAPLIPAVTLPADYVNGGDNYLAGISGQMSGQAGGTGLQRPYYMRFQAARENLVYFDDGAQADERFFESSWFSCTNDELTMSMSLLPNSNPTDSSFVNGHLYYVRAQTRDFAGNLSDWSDTLEFYMDAFAPSEISNLATWVKPDAAGSAAIIVMDWDAATEAVSGLKHYVVYRTGGGLNQPIAYLDKNTTYYEDTLDDVTSRPELCYQVGSVDNVGNAIDASQSIWVSCLRPPLPPDFSLACDTVVDGWCFALGSDIVVNWSSYFTGGVEEYEIQRSSDIMTIDDPSQTQYLLALPADTNYQVRMRTKFVGGTMSPWSDKQTIIRNLSAPNPVVEIWISNAEESDGNIYLDWSTPADVAGIGKYVIERRPGDSTSFEVIDTVLASDGTNYTDLYERDGVRLSAYTYYAYRILPMDVLGQVQTEGNAVDSAFCNRPPTFDSSYSGQGRLTVCWQRPSPNRTDSWGNWLTEVRVYRSSRDTLIYETSVADVTCFDYYPDVSANFIFEIREIAQAPCCENMTSAWSNTLTAPFNTRPAAPSGLVVQAQPMLPVGGDDEPPYVLSEQTSQAARIYLRWDYPDSTLADSFAVVRQDSEGIDTIVIASDGSSRYELMDSPLWAGRDYDYALFVWDTLGQVGLEALGDSRVDPIWMYTPIVKPWDPWYFNSDTLTVTLQWFDRDLQPIAGGVAGADSAFVELSNRADFQFSTDTFWLAAADGMVVVEGIRDLLDDAHKTIYARAKATDGWGHFSYWSTDYPALHDADDDTADVILDDLPPAPVDQLTIDSTRADTSSVSQTVFVYLSWQQVVDYGGSGVATYTVCRSVGEGELLPVAVLDQSTFGFTDERVEITGSATCDYRYVVRPSDVVGNERLAGNNIVCLASPRPPVLRTPETRRDLSWISPAPLVADSFYAECAYHRDMLGSGWMELLESDASTWVPSADTSWHFALDWQDDSIFYHVKTVYGSLESGWSELVVYTASEIPTDVLDQGEGLPTQMALYQNYPNPFNPKTRIAFDLPRAGSVCLRVYNIKGRVVRTLIDGTMAAGRHEMAWDGTAGDGSEVSSGVYLYRIQTEFETYSRKMTLIR